MISKVAELLTELEKLPREPHRHVRQWFRGQSKVGWPLLPGVYRPDFGQYSTEEERFRIEQHLNQDFRVMSAGTRTGHESNADMYFLQQHYRMPTRLLDWTTNPLAALYFASNGHEGEDGELYLMDTYQLEPQIGAATSRHPLFQRALRAITDWKTPTEAYPDPSDKTYPRAEILAVRPDHFDRRMTLQRSCFTFHLPKEPPQQPVLTPDQNKTLQSFKVCGGKKREIMDELSLLGIDQFSVYGDLEHLALRLRAAYC